MTTAVPSGVQAPLLGRLLGGTSWLAIQFLLQIVLSLWAVRLIVEAVGPDRAGAYRFAMGFGFLQFLFEFGAGSALQRELSDAWSCGDRPRFDRAIACGMNAYAAISLAQAAALVGIACLAVPHAGFDGAARSLAMRLLWLQATSTPFFGAATVASSVLKAARRYELATRCEAAITVARFAVLAAGVRAGVEFAWVAAAQAAVSVLLRLGPASWVIARELEFSLHFRGARRADYKALGRFSSHMAMIQIGSILADRIDVVVLGFALSDPGPQIAAYDVVGKPCLLLRQAGSMLTSLVMPAVAGLAAASDERGLERLMYDGSRLHIGLFLPVGLLAWIYAEPFLSLWIGDRLGPGAVELAPLMRLSLVAALPVALGVLVEAAGGLGRIGGIAAAALAGALVNLPLSWFLATRMGMVGVIWGAASTTLVANLIVPSLIAFRTLGVAPRTYLSRALAAPATGAVLAIVATWVLRSFFPAMPAGLGGWHRGLPLALHLGVGMLAYVVGYASVPAGRKDVAFLAAWLRRRARWIRS